MELRLGPLTCALFREIVIQVAEDPDATAVLRAARSFEFGLYQVNTAESGAERAEFLRATTTAMSARGWSRLVAVVDGPTTVALFVPDGPGSGNEIEFGVTVLDGRDLNVAVVNANLAPLFKLIRRHAGQEWNHGLLER